MEKKRIKFYFKKSKILNYTLTTYLNYEEKMGLIYAKIALSN